jgi:hypothetical protein
MDGGSAMPGLSPMNARTVAVVATLRKTFPVILILADLQRLIIRLSSPASQLWRIARLARLVDRVKREHMGLEP